MMSSNTDHTPSDVEGATAGVPMESAQRLLSEKKTIWQSIRANPKVIFIAFFASYVHVPYPVVLIALERELTRRNQTRWF